MSFATSIGHVHLPGLHRSAAPAVAPAPDAVTEPRSVRTWAALDESVADERHELEQWSAAHMLAIGLNR